MLGADILCTKARTVRATPHILTESRLFSDDMPRVGRYRTDECSINPDRSND